MGIAEVDAALTALSKAYEHQIEEPSDEKMRECFSRLKDFQRRSRAYCLKNGIPLVNPFNDPTERLNKDLPEDVLNRVRGLLGGLHPFRMDHRIVPYYVRYLYFKDDLREAFPGDEDLYSPFFSVLLEGVGVYFEHTGAMGIGDGLQYFTTFRSG